MGWIFLLLIPFIAETSAQVEITETSARVKIVYLRGISRLNNPSYKDYYFCCNSVGYTLQWVVNGSGLGGYAGGDVARVLHDSRSNFNYTATLLSSAATTGELYTFDSVLIVSLQGNPDENPNLVVTCTNGLTSNTTYSEVQSVISNQDRVGNGGVVLERVISQPIVSRTSTITPTSIFICGVNNEFMNWETASSDYGFSTYDSVGSRRQNLDIGEITVSQQALFLCTEPYRFVTVFFATGNSDITVTCGYPQDYVNLTSTFFSPKTTVTTSDSDITTSEDEPEVTPSSSTSSSVRIDTTSNGPISLDSGNSISAAALAGTAVVAVAVCCAVVTILITLWFIYMKKNREPYLKFAMEISTMDLKVHPNKSSWESGKNGVPTTTQAVSSTAAA